MEPLNCATPQLLHAPSAMLHVEKHLPSKSPLWEAIASVSPIKLQASRQVWASFLSKCIGICRNPSILPATLMPIFLAPCQPKGVNGYLDCVSNSAWISWDSALGASNYTVSAVGSGISTTNCTSITDTRCEVKDLACGVSFSFTVTAANSWCDSQPSASYSLETGISNLQSSFEMFIRAAEWSSCNLYSISPLFALCNHRFRSLPQLLHPGGVGSEGKWGNLCIYRHSGSEWPHFSDLQQH